jgi:Zn-dependent M28 family amino/carboxypeptidase
MEGFTYLGANDSASSSIGLVLMAKFLSESPEVLKKMACAPLFIWFDGEESVLPGWTDGETIHPARIQDNTYGSRHFVDNLEKCGTMWCFNSLQKNGVISHLILLDMIGSKELKFSNDRYSDKTMKSLFVEVLKKRNLRSLWISPAQYIEDDHIPFLEKGIKAINLIDFENLSHWHRHSDLPEYVFPESIELATFLALDLSMRLDAPIKP